MSQNQKLCSRMQNLISESGNEIYFKQHRDYNNGGYVQISHMISNSTSIGIEGGYSRFKNTDEKYSSDYIQSDIIHGMLNLTQYFETIDNKIKPYATIGAGIAKISAKGELSYDPALIKISFENLDKITFAYQFGVGFEASKQKKGPGFGIGYKYFATHEVSTHDDNLNLNITNASNNIKTKDNIDFGNLSHQNHMLNLFLKFNI